MLDKTVGVPVRALYAIPEAMVLLSLSRTDLRADPVRSAADDNSGAAAVGAGGGDHGLRCVVVVRGLIRSRPSGVVGVRSACPGTSTGSAGSAGYLCMYSPRSASAGWSRCKRG
jgi:hypothetical protein